MRARAYPGSMRGYVYIYVDVDALYIHVCGSS